MKILHTISILGLSLLMLSACNSDLDTVTYDAEQATPAVLKQIESAYVLEAQQSDQTAIKIQWEKLDMGYAASVTNTLEMDVKGKEFNNKVVLASTKTETSYEGKTSELNNKIVTLLEKYQMEFGAVDIEFRLVSSISGAAKPIYSNVLVTNITPYAGEREYPHVYIIGGYSNWGFNGQCLYSEKSNENYEGWVVFGGKAADGWKITPEAKWDTAWGYDGELPVGATSLTLAASAGNISCFDGFSYKYSFNTHTLQLKILASVKSWGLVGGHNGWGNDNAMTLGSEEKNGKTQYFLTVTVDMAAGNTFKIRADQDWANQINANTVDGDFESDGDNFKVSEAGIYTFKWYFNKVKGQLTIAKQ